MDLRSFLKWAAVHLGYSSLVEIEAAPPTAELEPIRTNYSQLDEVDMGMTYDELSVYGRLRKIFRCGPLSMFKNLCYKWSTKLTPAEVADKVKYFFKYYSVNRHKMTVLTPSYHAESYSPEDNRFDLRQFLYNVQWPYQFLKIDEPVNELGGDKVALTKSTEGENVNITADGGMGVVAAGSDGRNRRALGDIGNLVTGPAAGAKPLTKDSRPITRRSAAQLIDKGQEPVQKSKVIVHI